MQDNWVILFSHSRAQLATNAISSILANHGSENWKMMHIFQSGHEDSQKVFKAHTSEFDVNIQLEPNFSVALHNINFNRVLGYQLAFETLGARSVLGIEEDTIIALDALSFCEEILIKYGKERRFRGINLGSTMDERHSSAETFSLLRFGLQGQAGLITKETWRRVKSHRILNFDSGEGWDSSMEFEMKTGFIVTPNRSRCLDFGWNSGVHAPADENNEHYVKMRKSFVAGELPVNKNFRLAQVHHDWRGDSVAYVAQYNLLYDFRASKLWKFAKPFSKVYRSKLVKSLYFND